MLSAIEIADLIEICSKRGVTKFKAGNVEFTLMGHRDATSSPSQTSLLLEEMQNDKDWLNQDIPAAPLPPEVE